MSVLEHLPLRCRGKGDVVSALCIPFQSGQEEYETISEEEEEDDDGRGADEALGRE